MFLLEILYAYIKSKVVMMLTIVAANIQVLTRVSHWGRGFVYLIIFLIWRNIGDVCIFVFRIVYKQTSYTIYYTTYASNYESKCCDDYKGTPPNCSRKCAKMTTTVYSRCNIISYQLLFFLFSGSLKHFRYGMTCIYIYVNPKCNQCIPDCVHP